ncbi:MAG: hypothetical protein ACI9VM_000970, partial [Candidatus Azotimanducaceae bacterium]
MPIVCFHKYGVSCIKGFTVTKTKKPGS